MIMTLMSCFPSELLYIHGRFIVWSCFGERPVHRKGKTIVWTRARFTSPDHNSFPNRIAHLRFPVRFRRGFFEEKLAQRCWVLVSTGWHTRTITCNHLWLLGGRELWSHGRPFSRAYHPWFLANNHGNFVLGLICLAGEK